MKLTSKYVAWSSFTYLTQAHSSDQLYKKNTQDIKTESEYHKLRETV